MRTCNQMYIWSWKDKLYTGPVSVWLLAVSSSPSQRASKLLRGDCLYREKRCLFPWASLFIWAVLQNRSEMASFFWEMVRQLSALKPSSLFSCKQTWDFYFIPTAELSVKQRLGSPCLALSCSRPSRCSVPSVAARFWGNFPSSRVRPRPNCPWRSWPKSLRTWHMVRLTVTKNLKHSLILSRKYCARE